MCADPSATAPVTADPDASRRPDGSSPPTTGQKLLTASPVV